MGAIAIQTNLPVKDVVIRELGKYGKPLTHHLMVGAGNGDPFNKAYFVPVQITGDDGKTVTAAFVVLAGLEGGRVWIKEMDECVGPYYWPNAGDPGIPGFLAALDAPVTEFAKNWRAKVKARAPQETEVA